MLSSSGIVILDLKEMAKQIGVTVSNSYTSTNYCATMTDDVFTQTYNFDRFASDAANYTITTNGTPTDPIGQTRQ